MVASLSATKPEVVGAGGKAMDDEERVTSESTVGPSSRVKTSNPSSVRRLPERSHDSGVGYRLAVLHRRPPRSRSRGASA